MKPFKSILLVVHPSRADALEYSVELSKALRDAGFTVQSNREEFSIAGVDLAIVLGGDGTILRASEICRESNIPILGINLGSVGFLAQLGKPSVDDVVQAISNQSIRVEPRLLVAYEVERDKKIVSQGWALNEVVVEGHPGQMIELFVQIDNRPLSRWGCDGVICATPTGSTAYAFSAGGPIVWPDVPAFSLLPIAAHALFSKPMVVSDQSIIQIEVESASALLSADGLRNFELQAGDRVRMSRDARQIQLSHMENAVFTDRLVAKFKLPIEGWRGH